MANDKTSSILERAKARREGRFVPQQGRPTVPQHVEPNREDPLRDAILAGDVTLDDFARSEHMDEVFTTYPDTSWTEGGPQDIDAARATARGESYASPDEVRRLEVERGTSHDTADMLAKLRNAERETADQRVNAVQPLPGKGHDLNDASLDRDRNLFKNLRPATEEDVRNAFGDLDGLAQVGHNLPDDAGDQSATVRRLSVPPERES